MERKGLELGVGLFLLVGLLCLGYLSFKLGDVHPFGGSFYEVSAVFSNVAGMKERTSITMAGVNIGRIKKIRLKEEQALVTMNIRNDVRLEDDCVASIKTMGLIGDKYIAIAPGGSDTYIQPGGTIHETRPPLDIESLLGKYVFGNVDGSKSPSKSESKEN